MIDFFYLAIMPWCQNSFFLRLLLSEFDHSNWSNLIKHFKWSESRVAGAAERGRSAQSACVSISLDNTLCLSHSSYCQPPANKDAHWEKSRDRRHESVGRNFGCQEMNQNTGGKKREKKKEGMKEKLFGSVLNCCIRGNRSRLEWGGACKCYPSFSPRGRLRVHDPP